MLSTFEKKSGDAQPLYLRVYDYYKELIINGTLPGSTKLLSVRRCAQELGISRTTVEAAYMQLAAEGYIISKPQSGYYVAEIDLAQLGGTQLKADVSKKQKQSVVYDFSSTAVDKASFDFALWRRYIKSAFRADDRLLSYGDPQGEYDLRCAISDYVRKSRSVMCSPEQIIIGASVQSLLYYLCSVIGEKSAVAFTGPRFEKGETVFNDMGFESCNFENATDFKGFSEKNVKIIYTSPSHSNVLGDVLPVKDRARLLKYANDNGCIVIEDDYDSEFRYYSRPVPSLQGLGADVVVYMGTFSKLLLPSIRVSFMILPKPLLARYEKKKNLYNQTASKGEQIALCQFIRDGHLNSQIKKARKLYINKSNMLCQSIKKVFGEVSSSKPLQSGLFVLMSLNIKADGKKIAADSLENGVKVIPFTDEKDGFVGFLLSCSSLPTEDFEPALEILKKCVKKYQS